MQKNESITLPHNTSNQLKIGYKSQYRNESLWAWFSRYDTRSTNDKKISKPYTLSLITTPSPSSCLHSLTNWRCCFVVSALIRVTLNFFGVPTYDFLLLTAFWSKRVSLFIYVTIQFLNLTTVLHGYFSLPFFYYGVLLHDSCQSNKVQHLHEVVLFARPAGK